MPLPDPRPLTYSEFMVLQNRLDAANGGPPTPLLDSANRLYAGMVYYLLRHLETRQPSSPVLDDRDCIRIPIADAEMRVVGDIRDEYLRQIRNKLADGIPVTMTCGGRVLATFYPDGHAENHE